MLYSFCIAPCSIVLLQEAETYLYELLWQHLRINSYYHYIITAKTRQAISWFRCRHHVNWQQTDHHYKTHNKQCTTVNTVMLPVQLKALADWPRGQHGRDAVVSGSKMPAVLNYRLTYLLTCVQYGCGKGQNCQKINHTKCITRQQADRRINVTFAEGVIDVYCNSWKQGTMCTSNSL